MQIIEHIMTESDCWKAGRTIVPRGVMVHSTGVAQPKVEAFLKLWNQPGYSACVHAFVTETGVVQALPWNWKGWHSGKGDEGKVSANNTHISFEILEPAGHTYAGGTMLGYDVEKNAAYFAAVYENAVALTAMLCTKYRFDPMAPGVVICHCEGHELGIASNHADVLHWFPKHGKSMDTFRADVRRKMRGEDEEMTQQDFETMLTAAQVEQEARRKAQPVSAWAKEAWEKAAAAGIFDGTQPGGIFTREQAAVVLERLKLLK